MSEQLVIIVLIALTFIIVLIALAIPDESTASADPNDPVTTVEVRREEVAGALSTDHGRRSLVQTSIEEQGADPGDARRAVDIPEEAGR